jgi:hypothetical protein
VNPSETSNVSADEEAEIISKTNVRKKTKEAQESDKQPGRSQESWRDRRNKGPINRSQEAALHSIDRIPYGGSIKLKGVTIHLHNTCNIDNMMQILYSLYKVYPDTEYDI